MDIYMGQIIQSSLDKLRSLAQNSSSRFWPNIAHCTEYLLFTLSRGFQLKSKPSNEIVQSTLTHLRDYGFYVIPGFFSPELCADLRERIDFTITNKSEFVHPGSPYDFRLHGIENIDESFKFFSRNLLLNEIASAYLGEPSRAAFSLAARMEVVIDNAGSGGGWHRDSNFRQIKAMVYLSDTTERNGPLQLISKSHKLLQSMRDNGVAKQKYGEVRWTQKFIDCVLNITGNTRLKTLIGGVGTLAIFDSSAIHRGAPILDGTRYAITNYYYPERLITPSVYAHFYPVASFDKAGLPKNQQK